MTEIIQNQNDSSINKLITVALEQKADIQTLERLFSLQKEWEANEAKKEYIKAFSLLQGELPIVEKETEVKGKDGKLRYTYAKLEKIISEAKPFIAKHGFSYTFTEKKDKEMATAICTVRHSLGHSEEFPFTIEIGTEDYMTSPQKYGARMTFAKRYAFCNAFGIVTADEDDDANAKDGNQEPTSDGAKVIHLLKTLGYKTDNKEENAKIIESITQLKPTKENISEIISRLKIVVQEKNEANYEEKNIQ